MAELQWAHQLGLRRMWKRPKSGYDQTCTAWCSTGGSESILMEPRSDLSLNILLVVVSDICLWFWWLLMFPLWISQIFAAGSQVLNLPRFAPRLESQGIGAEKHWSFFTCWCCSMAPLFGKGASVPCLRQLGLCFPQHGASSGGVDGASGTTGGRKKFSPPRRAYSDPPVTRDGFGHGVPLSCP